MINFLLTAMLLIPAIALADPSPFGLEIGKATIKDVKAKYSVKSGKCTTWMYQKYLLMVCNPPEQSLVLMVGFSQSYVRCHNQSSTIYSIL